MKINYPDGATPLDPDEMAELIPNIRIQGELNDWEYKGITCLFGLIPATLRKKDS